MFPWCLSIHLDRWDKVDRDNVTGYDNANAFPSSFPAEAISGLTEVWSP